MLFPRARFPAWLAKRRRWIGVAAFGYAALHTIFYVVDIDSLQLIIDEFWAFGRDGARSQSSFRYIRDESLFEDNAVGYVL